MEPLRVGQVWREYHAKDYGHIIRWEVTAVGRSVSEVRNMATLERKAILKGGQLDTFTFSCELMEGETGWGNSSFAKVGV